ncbi:MAG: glycine oxidase ThiO [Proteobacteria bacterium]|nr:glycine oxidase ThiO [Pseudomonadota bacterium]MBI3499936.1 glycine oxidase ThiO [Pseudomonadota bacterium]
MPAKGADLSEAPGQSAHAAGRVAILGGGIIGLAIGWRLAEAGAAVDIFERGTAGHGASWAAAGMLAAGVETEPGEESLLPLARLSQELWPAFARGLEAASGMDVGLSEAGTLVVAFARDEAEQVRFSFELQRRQGVQLEWLARDAALELEPHLNPRLAAAYFSPGDGQVDNRLVVTALARAFRLAGGRLHEEAPVEAIDIEAGRASGVVVAGRLHPADWVVLAAGAWSREIAGLPEPARPPVRPVKGQMLALRMDKAAPLLRHVVWAPRAYLVPRGDGRLLVGATVEERGFEPSLTAGGLLALLDGAWRALPALEELPIQETWVGFRPGSPDDAPILGPSQIPGLVLACGHHRSGILLAPITASLIATFVLEGRLAEAIRPFAIDRFNRRSAPPADRRTA